MKNIILAILLLAVNTPIFSQNRFDRNVGVRSTYQPKFYDGRDLVELATSIYERRKAKAIIDCVIGYRETFESVVGEKNVIDDKQFVDSNGFEYFTI